jgi:hypothetical protein
MQAMLDLRAYEWRRALYFRYQRGEVNDSRQPNLTLGKADWIIASHEREKGRVEVRGEGDGVSYLWDNYSYHTVFHS